MGKAKGSLLITAKAMETSFIPALEREKAVLEFLEMKSFAECNDAPVQLRIKIVGLQGRDDLCSAAGVDQDRAEDGLLSLQAVRHLPGK